MNRAITITLSGVIFQIEESAYEKLNEYLNAVRDHLAGELGRDEIMSDIETNIAEKFTAKIDMGQKVIILSDINNLIAVMGHPDVFDDRDTDKADDGAAVSKTGKNEIKKLYRSSDDVIIGGVCAGLAAYFGWDPVIIRLIFVFSVLLGGAGIILYILLWIIVPKAKTASQRIEMQGQPVTLAALQKAVKKSVAKIKTPENAKNIKLTLQKTAEIPSKFLRVLGSALKKIAFVLFAIIRILTGLVFFITAIVSLASVTFIAIAIFGRINSSYIVTDIPLYELANENNFRIGVAAIYFAIIIPLIFLFQTGISLLRKKNYFSLISVGVMISISITGLILAGLIGLEYGPRIEEYTRQAGVTINQALPLTDFRKISVGDDYEVSVSRGDVFLVEASGSEKELARIRTEIINGELNIYKTPNIKSFCLFCLNRQRVKLAITLPELSAYATRDAAQSEISGFNGPQLSLSLSDAAKNTVDAYYEKFDIKTSDATNLKLTGTSTLINIELKDATRVELSGATDQLTVKSFDAAKLSARYLSAAAAEITMADASNAEVTVNEKLKAILSGAAKLRYYGQAIVTEEIKDVSANIIKLED